MAETKEYLLAFEKLKNIRILYEDEDILALDKPAGVLSQKASVADFSANEWLIGYLLSQKKLTAEALATFHPSVCNRLDRNTSGLLLCGKSLLGTQKLTGLIRNRQIHKDYRLFLLGEVKEKQILTGYLLKDTKKNQVKILTKPAEGADEIKTGIEPLACLELPGIGTVTYAQAELFTGKTHQIRAHFAWAGHPLLGDPKYGNEAVNRTPEANLRNRQAAVACMADPPEGRCLWHFTDRRHHLSAAGGFSEAAFRRNTALNHKSPWQLAPGLASAKSPCPRHFTVWKLVSYTKQNCRQAVSQAFYTITKDGTITWQPGTQEDCGDQHWRI